MLGHQALTCSAILMQSFWVALQQPGESGLISSLSCCTGASLKVELVDSLDSVVISAWDLS